ARRRLRGHWRTRPCHYEGDLAAEAFLVKLKSLLALAVKVKVGIQQHYATPLRFQSVMSFSAKPRLVTTIRLADETVTVTRCSIVIRKSIPGHFSFTERVR